MSIYLKSLDVSSAKNKVVYMYNVNDPYVFVGKKTFLKTLMCDKDMTVYCISLNFG